MDPRTSKYRVVYLEDGVGYIRLSRPDTLRSELDKLLKLIKKYTSPARSPRRNKKALAISRRGVKVYPHEVSRGSGMRYCTLAA